jgi:phosphoribosylamine-glycine ligase
MGLAAGKGVDICENYVEALAEFELMIQRQSLVMQVKKL